MGLTMPQAKQTSKQKRRSKALPVLGAAGLSLSLAGSASAVPGGPAVNLPTSGNGDGNQVFLGEKSQTLAWQRSMSSTKKAPMHLRWCSLSATAAAAVMAAEVMAATGVVAADMGAVATAAEAAITDAVAAVASALG